MRALAVLLVALASSAAHAQDEESADPTVAAPEPSSAAETSADEAPPAVDVVEERVARARRYFDEGTRLYEDARYETALARFRASFDELDGHDAQYTVIYNIAQCLERLGRLDEARARYARYLELAGPEAADRDAVLSRVAALGEVVGTLVVRVNAPTATLWESGRRIGDADEPIRLEVGTHGVELRARGYVALRREVEVQSGSLTTLEVVMEERARGLEPVYFGVGAGLAGASLAVAVGFAVGAQSAHDEALARLASDEPDRFLVDGEAQANRDRLALAADVFFGVAGACAIASAVLLAFTELRGDEAEPTEVTATPVLGPSVAGVSLEVRR